MGLALVVTEKQRKVRDDGMRESGKYDTVFDLICPHSYPGFFELCRAFSSFE
jgi:hypothetical protein